MAEKERFEVLLEEIKGKVQLVLEGHGVLDKKMGELQQEIGNLDKKQDLYYKMLNHDIKEVDKKVEGIKQTLDEHV